MEKLRKLQLEDIMLTSEDAKLILGGGGDNGDSGEDEYRDCKVSCSEGCPSACQLGGKCNSCQDGNKRV